MKNLFKSAGLCAMLAGILLLAGCPDPVPPDSDPVVIPPVKKIKTSTSLRTDADGNLQNKYVTEFNEEGLELVYSRYDKVLNFEAKTEYTYDSAGLLLTCTEYDSKMEIKSREEYVYDSMGNTLTYCEYGRNSQLKSRTESMYNSNGDAIQICIYDGNGNLTSKEETEYDSRGNRTKRVEYDENGEIKYKYECTYDDKDRPVEEINTSINVTKSLFEYNDEESSITERFYNENMELVDYKVSILNDKELPVKISKYDADGTFKGCLRYEYSDNSKPVKMEEYDENMNLKIYYEVTYDSNDEVIGSSCFNGDGTVLYCTKPLYDEKNNVIGLYYLYGGTEQKELFEFNEYEQISSMTMYENGQAVSKISYTYTYWE